MDNIRAWNNCVAKLQNETSKEEFKQWIKPLQPKFHGSKITLYAHNDFVFRQVKRKYLSNISSYLKSEPTDLNITSVKLEVSKPRVEQLRNEQLQLRSEQFETGLRDELTFEKFAVGPSNEEAFHASQIVAREPGSVHWNPLLIYGDVGLGKTHLLHSVGNWVRSHAPEQRVRYLYTAEFVRDVVQKIRQASVQSYLDRFDECDVLILDEVQDFVGKDKCAEEFTHLFNKFESRGAQMVFGSNQHPDDIQGLNPSLKSRFKARLVIGLRPLNFDTRVQLLNHWAETRRTDWRLPQGLVRYIAENVLGDARNLTSFWERLTMPAINGERIITKQRVDETLRSGYSVRKPISVEQIQTAVAEHYGISEDNLLGSTRRADVVRCRHMAMYLCHRLTKLPLLSIAGRFNRKDHTTVKHACGSIRRQIEQDRGVQSDYEEILEKIVA